MKELPKEIKDRIKQAADRWGRLFGDAEFADGTNEAGQSYQEGSEAEALRVMPLVKGVEGVINLLQKTDDSASIEAIQMLYEALSLYTGGADTQKSE